MRTPVHRSQPLPHYKCGACAKEDGCDNMIEIETTEYEITINVAVNKAMWIGDEINKETIKSFFEYGAEKFREKYMGIQKVTTTIDKIENDILTDEPNWDGLYICLDCGKGISHLTANSYQGKCVSCFKKPNIERRKFLKAMMGGFVP